MRKKWIFCLLLLPAVLHAQTMIRKAIMPPAKSSPAATGTPLQQSLARGKDLYKLACLTCHQPDGGGVGTLNPPFVQEWAGGEKSRIIRMILKGSKGKVSIDGDTFSNTMAAQAGLTDQQIADALTFVRNNFGIKASAVTAAEVKAVRSKAK
jgi:mono/diheme cytochrome c family protein